MPSKTGPLMWSAALVACSFLAAMVAVDAFAPSLPGTGSLRNWAGHRCAQQRLGLRMQGKGFGTPSQPPKKAKEPETTGKKQTLSEQEATLRAVMGDKQSSDLSPFAGSVDVDNKESKQSARRGQRAEPVNLDAGAMFDGGWLKQSVDTVLSDEWVQGSSDAAEAECSTCDGSGRIQGGLGTLPGLKWWPIKAFRPCPECEEAGRTYNRRGQGLDEVLFGKDDMPLDYKKPTTGGGLTPDDVKKIMDKGNKKKPGQ